MKHLVLIVMILMSGNLLGQSLNGFDSDGKRHGKWKKNFEGTQVVRYEGTFSHGKEVGLFKFYKNIKGLPVLTATRQFHEKDDLADVTFFASDGRVISEGLMRGKTYIGPWKYYHNNKAKQLMTLEHYNNKGELDGKKFIYYPNGQIAEQTFYKANRLDGEALWYTEEGVLIKKYQYVLGELHGEAKFYDKAGILVAEGVYKKDKKHGIWKYYEEGKLKEEKDFTVRSKNPYKKK